MDNITLCILLGMHIYMAWVIMWRVRYDTRESSLFMKDFIVSEIKNYIREYEICKECKRSFNKERDNINK